MKQHPSERHLTLSIAAYKTAGTVRRGHKPPPFVKLAIIGQVRLWHNAQYTPLVDDRRTVIELCTGYDRQSGDNQHRQRARLRAQRRQSGARAFNQRFTQKKIAACIARQA